MAPARAPADDVAVAQCLNAPTGGEQKQGSQAPLQNAVEDEQGASWKTPLTLPQRVAQRHTHSLCVQSRMPLGPESGKHGISAVELSSRVAVVGPPAERTSAPSMSIHCRVVNTIAWFVA